MTPGVGTAYLTAFRDKIGAYLLGDKNYRLRVPANPPVKRFWAVTAYDPLSRSLLGSGGQINCRQHWVTPKSTPMARWTSTSARHHA